MASKLWHLRLHRWTVVTLGCGITLVIGLAFFAGALIGHWWAERPAEPVVAEGIEGSELGPEGGVEGSTVAVQAPADGGMAAEGAPPGTTTTATAATGSGLAPRVTGPTATGPRVTGPTATGPRVTGPRISSSGITAPQVTGPHLTGPRVSNPQVRGPRVTAPRAPTARSAARTVAGGGTAAGGGATAGAAAGVGSPVGPGAEVGTFDPVTGALLDPAEGEAPPVERFAVQVGLFADPEDAQAAFEDLSGRGHAPYLVMVRALDRGTVARSLRLGPFPTREAAQEAARNFQLDESRSAAVVRELEAPVEMP